jgi:hypothetical protein
MKIFGCIRIGIKRIRIRNMYKCTLPNRMYGSCLVTVPVHRSLFRIHVIQFFSDDTIPLTRLPICFNVTSAYYCLCSAFHILFNLIFFGNMVGVLIPCPRHRITHMVGGRGIPPPPLPPISSLLTSAYDSGPCAPVSRSR